MVRIAAFAYRGWARELIFGLWSHSTTNNTHIRVFHSPDDVNVDSIKILKPDIILFYGWSWKVPEEIIENHLCLCLHPSPLPKYRGGSPIQNQIMDGCEMGAVSIFRMIGEIDAGPLCFQREISLKGSLKDVFLEIKNVGLLGTTRMINAYRDNTLDFWEQEGEPTYCKRRTPEMSEITLEEIETATPEYLYNKIRGLQEPYPNAFITCANGNRLYITRAHCG